MTTWPVLREIRCVTLCKQAAAELCSICVVRLKDLAHTKAMASMHARPGLQAYTCHCVYLNVGRGFCQLDDTFHAIQKAQACELSQDHRQDSMHVVCEQVMPHTLTCTTARHSIMLYSESR